MKLKKGKCKVCGREGIFCRGMCTAHYIRWQRGKDMNARLKDPDNPERFWEKVKKTDGCWIWTASIYGKGYGKYTVRGKHYAAHRYAYELIKGKIPDGMQLDHLCRNKLCVNPDHLEPVTNAENQRRAIAAIGHWTNNKSWPAVCIRCGKHFDSHRKNGKFCSKECCWKYHNDKRLGRLD